MKDKNFKPTSKTIFWIIIAVILIGVVGILFFLIRRDGLKEWGPDSIGGVLGILLGFLIEMLLFEKVRDDKKYETLRKLLDREFNDIAKVCIENLQKINVSRLTTIKGDTLSPYLCPILEDIMDLAENLVLFDKYDGKLLEDIRLINTDIIKAKSYFEEGNTEKFEKITKDILIYIIEVKFYFSKITEENKNDLLKKWEWDENLTPKIQSDGVELFKDLSLPAGVRLNVETIKWKDEGIKEFFKEQNKSNKPTKENSKDEDEESNYTNQK